MKKLQMSQKNVYRYNLYGGIEGFDKYEDFIEDMASFSSSDAVALYINSPGGDVDVGVSILNAIRTSEAPTTTVVEGPSYSMASIIALSGDKLIMLDNTYIMFHNYSSIAYGKGAELMNSVRHSDDHFNNLMLKVCSPFLTKRELSKIQRDEDIYIYSDDALLDKRCERHFR